MPLNIDWQQILLHLFNFVLLFTIMYLLLYKPVKKYMQKRSDYYKDLDKQSKDTLDAAKDSKTQYEDQLKNVSQECDALKDQAQKDASALSESIIADAKIEAQKIIENAKVGAERERKLALDEVNKEIPKLVTDAASKIICKSTDSAYEDFLNTVEGSEKDE